jgi:hypothetical protein
VASEVAGRTVAGPACDEAAAEARGLHRCCCCRCPPVAAAAAEAAAAGPSGSVAAAGSDPLPRHRMRSRWVSSPPESARTYSSYLPVASGPGPTKTRRGWERHRPLRVLSPPGSWWASPSVAPCASEARNSSGRRAHESISLRSVPETGAAAPLPEQRWGRLGPDSKSRFHDRVGRRAPEWRRTRGPLVQGRVGKRSAAADAHPSRVRWRSAPGRGSSAPSSVDLRWSAPGVATPWARKVEWSMLLRPRALEQASGPLLPGPSSAGPGPDAS